MTEKQEKLLQAALELFAQEGYNATPTSKVAKRAGVSEGLIFRHFKNKEGLANAIIEQANEQVTLLFSSIMKETDPKAILRKAIELPFQLSEEELSFWRLMYKLKWELNRFNKSEYTPLKKFLSEAFEKLGYPAPEIEAEILVLLSDSIASARIQGLLEKEKEVYAYLLQKYDF